MTGKVELRQDTCLWNSDYLDSSPLSVEDSGIDSDPKQRSASHHEDDKLFPVGKYYSFILDIWSSDNDKVSRLIIYISKNEISSREKYVI